jgi:hypothetical protein
MAQVIDLTQSFQMGAHYPRAQQVVCQQPWRLLGDNFGVLLHILLLV